MIQLPGDAIRLPAKALVEVIAASPTLRLFLLRYVQSLSTQTSFTALVNARSKAEERLARWLLMCADRVDGDELQLTHEYLSIMLGVRRPGVTVAVQILEGKGFIMPPQALSAEINILWLTSGSVCVFSGSASFTTRSVGQEDYRGSRHRIYHSGTSSASKPWRTLL